jgi:hypothetical protein
MGLEDLESWFARFAPDETMKCKKLLAELAVAGSGSAARPSLLCPAELSW